jgi:hypothetical protein
MEPKFKNSGSAGKKGGGVTSDYPMAVVPLVFSPASLLSDI